MAAFVSSRPHIYTMLATLLFLSYVMSCAPRYWRERRDNEKPQKQAATMQSILNAGKRYALDPYKNLWRSWQPAVRDWRTSVTKK